jgi:sugar phosphate isomerase/epimerase
MQESMYGYMKPGLVHFKAFPELMQSHARYVETLRIICEDDFWTAVEIGPCRDTRDRDIARKMLEVSHLTVAYATQPTAFPMKLNPHDFDAAERKRVLNIIKHCVDEAYEFGAQYFRISSGKDPGDAKRPDAKRHFVDFMHEICRYTKDNGDMVVTLKIFDRDIDKCFLVGHFADAAEVARPVAAEWDNFGLLSDMSHFPLLNETPEEAIPLIKDYFLHFHIGNCVVKDKKHFLYGDLQPRFGVPGGSMDTKDVAHYFRVLLEHGLLKKDNPPLVSAEVRPLLAEETSALVIANTKRVIREAWAQA